LCCGIDKVAKGVTNTVSSGVNAVSGGVNAGIQGAPEKGKGLIVPGKPEFDTN